MEETRPHNHSFTHLGDHNFFRDPNGASEPQAWCFNTDLEHKRKTCSVPFFPPLKSLDFSLDKDKKADENNSYTHATLWKENLPPSFIEVASVINRRGLARAGSWFKSTFLPLILQ